jgi:hypothetical protein
LNGEEACVFEGWVGWREKIREEICEQEGINNYEHQKQPSMKEITAKPRF